MMGLPASCSTWILSFLLLHFFISFQPLSSAPAKVTRFEFETCVDKFSKNMANCPESCDPGHRMNGSCSCFNFSISPQECAFREYFIKGLNSMHPNTSSLPEVPILVTLINELAEFIDTKVPHCSSKVGLMSPKRLSVDLMTMMQMFNTVQKGSR